MFAKYLDGLADNGLVEIAFGDDRVTPEGNRCNTQAGDCEIGETSERPTQHFQHPDIPIL